MQTMETTFENKTPQYAVSELWVDTVSSGPVSIDWQERYNEGEGWTSYEAPECPACSEYGRYSDDTYAWVCDNSQCEQHGQEIEDEYNEGPMMNYYYPLPDLRRIGDDPKEAAWRIRDLPLCVVQFEDEEYALALTGGGMDLSWEICEAFTRLGFLPPLHYCDLPSLAGKHIEGDALYTLTACKRSAEVVEYQAQQTRERLDRIAG